MCSKPEKPVCHHIYVCTELPDIKQTLNVFLVKKLLSYIPDMLLEL